MTALDYFKKCWKDWFVFEGRASRSEYWYFLLIHCVILFIGVFIGITLLENSKNVGIIFLIILLLYFVISIPAMISVTVRRLHDIGYNGAWFFISFIPLIGGVWAFVLSVLDSQVGENRFGNNPWGIGNGAGTFCSNCGEKTEKNDNKVSFCTHCGEKVYIDSDEEKESQKKKDVWV